MPKKVFTVRHALKLKSVDKPKWKANRWYKENFLDTPLAPIGFKNAKRAGLEFVNQHKKGILDITKTNYVYSSPMTRCTDTAVEIIKVVKEKLNHELKLRIDTRIWEGVGLCKIIKFVGDKPTTIAPKYIVLNGKKYHTELDSKLQYNYLAKKYKKYIDTTYKQHKDYGIELPEVSAVRIIKGVACMLYL